MEEGDEGTIVKKEEEDGKRQRWGKRQKPTGGVEVRRKEARAVGERQSRINIYLRLWKTGGRDCREILRVLRRGC